LLDLVTPLHEKNEALFSLAYQALKTIEGSLNREIITRTFEIKLLKLSGFRPQLDQCVHCQKEAEGAARFSLRLGGLLCENDFVCDRSARLISKGTLASLKHLEKSAWPVSLNLKTTLSVGEELKQLLEEFLNYHLERRPKSLQFLKKMGSGTTLPASLLQRVPDPSLSTSKAKNSLQTDAFC
jgi:DNA repair protein RecO (recombination protein O)